MDLRPTRQARTHLVAGIVVRDLILEPLNQFRAFGTGSDQAHVAFEYVPELRELIDVIFPHESPNLEAPGIILRAPDRARGGLGVDAHASDLENLKCASAAAGATLLVENRARGLQVHDKRENRNDEHGDSEADQSPQDIRHAFHEPVYGAIKRQLADAEQRYPAQRLYLETGPERWEIFGHHLEPDHLALAEPDQVLNLARRA